MDAVDIRAVVTDAELSPGDLEVWHIPDIPGAAFCARVPDLATARAVLDLLAFYDLFHVATGLTADYSNGGGVRRWESDEQGGYGWVDVEPWELEDALEELDGMELADLLDVAADAAAGAGKDSPSAAACCCRAG